MTPRQWQYAVAAGLILAAVLVQGVLAGLWPLPGAVPPLVLVIVIGLGMSSGPDGGAAAGFGAGLLLDLVPTTATTVGVTALSLLVVGALAGRVRDPRGLAPLQAAGVVAALAAAGWLLSISLLWVVGDPTPPLTWGLGYVMLATVLGAGLVPAVLWLMRRFDPGRRRRPARHLARST